MIIRNALKIIFCCCNSQVKLVDVCNIEQDSALMKRIVPVMFCFLNFIFCCIWNIYIYRNFCLKLWKADFIVIIRIFFNKSHLRRYVLIHPHRKTLIIGIFFFFWKNNKFDQSDEFKCPKFTYLQSFPYTFFYPHGSLKISLFLRNFIGSQNFPKINLESTSVKIHHMFY